MIGVAQVIQAGLVSKMWPGSRNLQAPNARFIQMSAVAQNFKCKVCLLTAGQVRCPVLTWPGCLALIFYEPPLACDWPAMLANANALELLHENLQLMVKKQSCF